MFHAYRNPIRVFDLDDLTVLIDPDRAGGLLEIGVADLTRAIHPRRGRHCVLIEVPGPLHLCEK